MPVELPSLPTPAQPPLPPPIYIHSILKQICQAIRCELKENYCAHLQICVVLSFAILFRIIIKLSGTFVIWTLLASFQFSHTMRRDGGAGGCNDGAGGACMFPTCGRTRFARNSKQLYRATGICSGYSWHTIIYHRPLKKDQQQQIVSAEACPNGHIV